jgi:hypothetical protein
VDFAETDFSDVNACSSQGDISPAGRHLAYKECLNAMNWNTTGE